MLNKLYRTAKHQTIGRVFSKDYGEVACRCTYLNISRQSYTYREPKPAGHFTNNTHTHKHTYQLTTAMESRTVFCETSNWTYIPISTPVEQNREQVCASKIYCKCTLALLWHTHAQSRMSQALLCCAYKYSKHFLWSAWWSSQALEHLHLFTSKSHTNQPSKQTIHGSTFFAGDKATLSYECAAHEDCMLHSTSHLKCLFPSDL